MYVCVCNSISDRTIRKTVENGACTMQDLSYELGVATCCGKCEDSARELMQSELARTDSEKPEPSAPVMLVPAGGAGA